MCSHLVRFCHHWLRGDTHLLVDVEIVAFFYGAFYGEPLEIGIGLYQIRNSTILRPDP
jgi:hypothetical protein